MTDPQRDNGGTELDQAHSPAVPAIPDTRPTAGSPVDAPVRRPAWGIFVGLAASILVIDQLTKAWIVATIEPGTAIRLADDYLRLINSENDGALFGLFGNAAPVMAVVSLVVIGLIVGYHARSSRNLILSTALGLLLGGAIGNLVDRVRFGFVIDWVDMGIGNLRFWTYNVGDAAITVAILLLILLALRPGLGSPAAHD